MTVQKKPEVNLEISSGFFRIPTQEMVYNITVISDRGGVQVVEKIVEVEKQMESSGGMEAADPYYQQVCQYAVSEFGGLLASFTALGEERGEENSGLDRSKLEQAREGLQALKGHALLAGKPGNEMSGSVVDVSSEIAEIVGKLQQLKAMAGQSASGAEADDALVEDVSLEPPQAAAKRYLFDLDVVFQTLYELCTNEAVKSHISSARENRETFFDKDLFLDCINETAAELEADSDNFFNMQMSDVLSALRKSCTEKPIQNLLKKMDSNQSSIFLDSILPLEVPQAEEVVVPAAGQDETPAERVAAGVDLSSFSGEIDEVLRLVDVVADKMAETSMGQSADASGSGEDLDGFQQELAGVIASLDEALAGGGAAAASMGDGMHQFESKMLAAVLGLQRQLQLKKENAAIDANAAQQQAAAAVAPQAEKISGRQAVMKALRAVGVVS